MSSQFSTFWPATGLYVGALLLSERRRWTGLVVVAAAADLVVSWHVGRRPLLAGAFVLGDALEALTAATLIQAVVLRARPRMWRLRDLLAVMALGAVVSPLVPALLGGTATHLTTGFPLWHASIDWWAGDSLGIVVVTPLLLAWASPDGAGWSPVRRRPLEFAALIAATLAVNWVVLRDAPKGVPRPGAPRPSRLRLGGVAVRAPRRHGVQRDPRRGRGLGHGVGHGALGQPGAGPRRRRGPALPRPLHRHGPHPRRRGRGPGAQRAEAEARPLRARPGRGGHRRRQPRRPDRPRQRGRRDAAGPPLLRPGGRRDLGDRSLPGRPTGTGRMGEAAVDRHRAIRDHPRWRRGAADPGRGEPRVPHARRLRLPGLVGPGPVGAEEGRGGAAAGRGGDAGRGRGPRDQQPPHLHHVEPGLRGGGARADARPPPGRRGGRDGHRGGRRRRTPGARHRARPPLRGQASARPADRGGPGRGGPIRPEPRPGRHRPSRTARPAPRPVSARPGRPGADRPGDAPPARERLPVDPGRSPPRTTSSAWSRAPTRGGGRRSR